MGKIWDVVILFMASSTFFTTAYAQFEDQRFQFGVEGFFEPVAEALPWWEGLMKTTEFIVWVLVPLIGIYAVFAFIFRKAFDYASRNFRKNASLGSKGLNKQEKRMSNLLALATSILTIVFFGGFLGLIMVLAGLAGIIWFIWALISGTGGTIGPLPFGSPDFRNSGDSESGAGMDEAEEMKSQAADSVSDVAEGAREAEGGDMPSEEAPEPEDLYAAVKMMEEPVKAFESAIKATEKDIRELIEKAKRLEEEKEKERELLFSIKNDLEEAEYRLNQLTGAEDVVEDLIDQRKEDLKNKFDTIESKLDNIEEKQSMYQSLLTEEERQILKDLKDNKRALNDIRALINTIPSGLKAEVAISHIVTTAEEYHSLEIAEEEIRKLEMFIRQTLEEEKYIIEELEELEQVERETEQITEAEIQTIQEMIQEDNRIEDLLGMAREDEGEFYNHLSEDDYSKMMNELERLKSVLETLGAEFEEEGGEEESIEGEAEKAEKDISEGERQAEEEEGEVEKETEETSDEVDREEQTPDITEPWQLVAKNPGLEPDWSKKDEQSFKGGWKWSGAWIYNTSSRDLPKQGWKIHVAADPDNKEEVFEVVKAILPVLNQMDSERKFAAKAEHIRDVGETTGKVTTIYPKRDDKAEDKVVNTNRRTTEVIIQNLIDALGSSNLLRQTKKIDTIGEFSVGLNGSPTRIFVRYDIIKPGNDVEDIDGSCQGDRKPGVVPQGFSQRNNIDLNQHGIEELKGLKTLSFDLDLPRENFN